MRGFDWRNKMSVGTDTVASAMVANTLETPTQDTPTQDTPTPEGQTPTKAWEAHKVEILENVDILRLGID